MTKPQRNLLLVFTVVCLSVIFIASALAVVTKSKIDEKEVNDIPEYPLSFLYEVQRALDDVMLDFNIGNTGVNITTHRLDVGLHDRSMENTIIAFLKTKFDGFDDRCIVFEDARHIVPSVPNQKLS